MWCGFRLYTEDRERKIEENSPQIVEEKSTPLSDKEESKIQRIYTVLVDDASPIFYGFNYFLII